jgi:Ran GTPase-activating protein (RanGAP) involved in mRNA processing and transport
MSPGLTHVALIKPAILPKHTKQVISLINQIPDLQILKLSQFSLNESFESLMELISKQSQLQSLDLSDTRLSAKQLVQLADTIKTFRHLANLSLAFNSLQVDFKPLSKQFVAAIETLSCLPRGNLNHIDLSGMQLGSDTALQLASSLIKSTKLCAVHLSQNGVSTETRKQILGLFNISP